MTSRPPTSTYRLQLGPDLPFAAAGEAVPYLASLGVSHLHLSPVLQAAPGSTHGYDVVDHTRISAELGGERGLRSLATTAHEHGMGLVVDIVPNHMALPAPEHLNRPLWSVLREGPTSRHARWFDIEWEAQGGRILLPVLGDRIGAELGAVKLDRLEGPDSAGGPDVAGGPDGAGGETILRYHDHTFPLRPGTEGLPLPELLDHQWYRLAWWRLGSEELNYRRFFTISDLIGLRTEDPEVFSATHGLLLRLMDEGVVDGFRIDHPDGLADPRGYLRRLDEATAGRWAVVEKVLTGDERLPADWACAGTTGYDALRHVDGLFVCPAGAAELVRVYGDFTTAGRPDHQGVPDHPDPPDRLHHPHHPETWPETARHAAREIVTGELAAEVGRLTRLAVRICAGVPELRDHSARALRTAVEELLIAYPVYRPYVVPGEPAPPEAVRDLDLAAQSAVYAFDVPEESAAVVVVRDLALGALGRGTDKDGFVTRFAQVSTAVRAKGVEDTAFYRWYPLLSANEVGGDPGSPSVDPADFHAFCARVQRDRPYSGTVLSTHDTKRSADVRARLATLSETPQAWRAWLTDVTVWYARHHRGDLPDRNAEYLIWQTYLGAGYLHDPDRLLATLRKSLREAGLHTGWTAQDAAYEDAVLGFAADVAPTVLYYAAEFAAARRGSERANVLGAALLHLTMPGVPDVYQGTETVSRTLVDPDNRRPVDFRGLALQLRRTDEHGAARTLEADKLRLTAAALRLRREHPEWFGRDGGYTPLHAHGPAAAHAVAFSRADRVVPVVTRFTHRLDQDGGWRETALALPGPPGAEWTDLLTGRPVTPGVPPTAQPGQVRLGDLLDSLPVALLVRR